MSISSTYASTVNSFYLAFYGRPADPAGLQFWTSHLEQVSGDLGTIIHDFANSAEAQTRFGSDDIATRITDIYQQLFNREPEPAGLAYWIEAVDSGAATLAEVSLAILNGSQGADRSLSALRQQAAERFTAEVAKSGIAYDGYAAVEVARLLVQGVTADATSDDISAMIVSVGKLVNVAQETPSVLAALSGDAALVSLLQTARGSADPVALLHTLAEVADAAAGNPATLDALLRGGGMEKVLVAMPSKATLQDVIEALDKGGLGAAVDVVYPPAPADKTPHAPQLPAAGTFTLHEAEGMLTISGTDTRTAIVNLTEDTITHGQQVIPAVGDLTDAIGSDYRGKVILTGTLAELQDALSATDGVDGYEIVDTKNVLFSGVPGQRVFASPGFAELAGGAGRITLGGVLSMEERGLLAELPRFDVSRLVATVDTTPPEPGILYATTTGADTTITAPPDVFYSRTGSFSIYANGKEANTSVKLEMSVNGVEWDTPVNSTNLAEGSYFYRLRVTDEAGNSSVGNIVKAIVDRSPPNPVSLSSEPDGGLPYSITGVEPEARLEYSLDNQVWSKTAFDTEAGGTYTWYVRQVDRAGNSSMPAQVSFTVSDSVPATPTATLAEDSGVSNVDGITSKGVIKLGKLDVAAGTKWQWSDDGTTWHDGGTADSQGQAVIDVAALNLTGARDMEFRQVNAAGTPSAASEPVHIELDKSAPVNQISLLAVRGSTSEPDTTNYVEAEVFFSYEGTLEEGAYFTWRLDEGEWITVAPGSLDPVSRTVTLGPINLAAGDPTVELCIVDVAGNAGAVLGQKINGPYPGLAVMAEASPEGLKVTATQDGQLVLEDSNVPARYDVFNTDGGQAVAGTEVLLGVQDERAEGVVKVINASLDSAVDPTGRMFLLGTSADDINLQGQYVWGFEGNDELVGTITADYLVGGAGNDSLLGSGGRDILIGGDGDDTIRGATGADRIEPGTGSDTAQYSTADESYVRAGTGVPNGFDTIVLTNHATLTLEFGPGDQVSDMFDPMPLQKQQSESAMPVSGDALLAALDAAFGSLRSTVPTAEAALVEFVDHRQFLMVDAQGDGIIDSDDWVIEIVGTVEGGYLSGNHIIFGAMN